MRTLADLLYSRSTVPPGITVEGDKLPWGKQLKLGPGRSLRLPSSADVLDGAFHNASAIPGLTGQESAIARQRLLLSPGLVIPLRDQTEELLQVKGLDRAKFRQESTNSVLLSTIVTFDQDYIGVAEADFLSHHPRPGLTTLIGWSESWTSDLGEAATELAVELLTADNNVVIGPEPSAPAWRKEVMLIGGRGSELPTGWERAMQLASGLYRIQLDIRPNPDSRRVALVNHLQQAPPDGLIVWTDFVPVPEVYTEPYRRARPHNPNVRLGPSHAGDDFSEVIRELSMQLTSFDLAGFFGQPPTVSASTDFPAAALDLECASFVYSDRAKKHLQSLSYPDPERMLHHLTALAELAAAYHAEDGRLGGRISDLAIQNYGIQIALHDDTLVAPPVHIEGNPYPDLDATPHVKVDDAKSADQVGRIYFALDVTTFRVVVDHVGVHDYGA